MTNKSNDPVVADPDPALLGRNSLMTENLNRGYTDMVNFTLDKKVTRSAGTGTLSVSSSFPVIIGRSIFSYMI